LYFRGNDVISSGKDLWRMLKPWTSRYGPENLEAMNSRCGRGRQVNCHLWLPAMWHTAGMTVPDPLGQ
jgi:hypothetical protein